jgi:predicted PurR-regulated permease PerM
VGSGAVVIGVGLVAYLQFESAAMAALVAGIALALQVLKGGILAPKMVGRAARMNDVAVFTSLLLFGWLWGGAGLLLAVPLTMIAKAVCDRVEDLRPLGELLGT